jgi:hypothetical protein
MRCPIDGNLELTDKAIGLRPRDQSGLIAEILAVFEKADLHLRRT